MPDAEQRYAELLLEWNQRQNLTGARTEEELRAHLAQARGMLALGWSGVRSVIDIGSGGGLPAIPLAIALSEVSFTLLDASLKKTAFLRHVAGRLGLKNVVVETGRAEQLAHAARLRERFDRALSRAAARPAVLLELALPFVQVGGDLVAAIGELDPSTLARAASTLGGGPPRVEVLPQTGPLLLVAKSGMTPAEYPRRAGVPQRRPLA
jgi:16S rRNA (guanine527-N7)-methyltransferase